MVEYFPYLLFLFIPIVIFQVRRLRSLLLKKRKACIVINKRLSEIKYLDLLTSDAANKKRLAQDSFNLYLDRLKEIVGWDYHSMFMLDESTQTLKARFTGYLPDWYIEQFSKKVFVKNGDASVGRATATKQPVIINTVANDPRFKSVSAVSKQISYKSLTCSPVTGRLKTYGGFVTYSNFENIFKVHDVQFFLMC